MSKILHKGCIKKCRLPHIPYQNRLEFLELHTLEFRRKILDLLTAHKIINGQTHLDPNKLFNSSNIAGRTHFQRILPKFRKHKKSNSFTDRISKSWNKIDQNIIRLKSPNLFKQNLIKHLLHTSNNIYKKQYK